MVPCTVQDSFLSMQIYISALSACVLPYQGSYSTRTIHHTVPWYHTPDHSRTLRSHYQLCPKVSLPRHKTKGIPNVGGVTFESFDWLVAMGSGPVTRRVMQIPHNIMQSDFVLRIIKIRSKTGNNENHFGWIFVQREASLLLFPLVWMFCST